VNFTYPANLRFQCTKCGICCGDTQQKTRHILLLTCEAKEIAEKTSNTTADFCEETSGNTPYIYEMKKTSDGKCVFLKNNNCTIYSFRPLICRFYPFELKPSAGKEKYVFDFTLECPGISLGEVLRGSDFEKLFFLAQARLEFAKG
jgi:Fe-S-cluster containining protein